MKRRATERAPNVVNLVHREIKVNNKLLVFTLFRLKAIISNPSTLMHTNSPHNSLSNQFQFQTPSDCDASLACSGNSFHRSIDNKRLQTFEFLAENRLLLVRITQAILDFGFVICVSLKRHSNRKIHNLFGNYLKKFNQLFLFTPKLNGSFHFLYFFIFVRE